MQRWRLFSRDVTLFLTQHLIDHARHFGHTLSHGKLVSMVCRPARANWVRTRGRANASVRVLTILRTGKNGTVSH